MWHFSQFQNYVFDLYGTLVSIRTDENQPALWKWLCDYYQAFGSHYTPAMLRRQYHQIILKEETAIRKETGCEYPEVQLEHVFLRLLEEGPGAFGILPETQSARKAWAAATANAFRISSRLWLRPYPGAKKLLGRLKAQGKRIYLLSNAQSVFSLPEIAQCGLMELFDDIWISSDHGMKKPEPLFLSSLMDAHRMAVSETIMIGNDPVSDMGIAVACGISGAWIQSDHQTKKQRREFIQSLAEIYSTEGAARIQERSSIQALYAELCADYPMQDLLLYGNS